MIFRGWRLFRRAQRFQHRGAYRRAAKLYGRGLELDGGDRGVLLWRAVALAEVGRFDEAHQHLEGASSAIPLFRARILFDEGSVEQALALVEHDANEHARALSGLCLLRLGRIEEARRVLAASLPYAPWLLGRLLLAIEERVPPAPPEPAAIPEISAAAEAAGWLAQRAALRQLRHGLLHLRAGRCQKAFHAFREAHRSMPDHPRVGFGLGASLYYLNHFEQARHWLLRALKQLEEPFVTDAEALLGKISLELTETADAVLRLRRAIAAGAAEPENYYALGLAFLRRGQTTLARRAFEKCASPEFVRERLGKVS